jgi:hypothetical protein
MKVAGDARVGLTAPVGGDIDQFESTFVVDHFVEYGIEVGHEFSPSLQPMNGNKARFAGAA